jgi:sulfur relay (sulfurtransferase) DsrF/TusC family protein
MGTFQKRKAFEGNIPAYAFNKASDIMMFTYAHAYYAVFPTRNIKKAITLFMQDFDLYDTFDIESAMVCYQRVREKFLNEQRREYESTEIADMHVRTLLEVMIWAWITFLKKHVHADYDIEQAIIFFGQYFDIEFTTDELIMYERRFKDSEQRIGYLPTVPMDYNIKK